MPVGGHLGALVGVLVGVGLGLAGYVAIQAALGAPELPPGLRFGSASVAAATPGTEGTT